MLDEERPQDDEGRTDYQKQNERGRREEVPTARIVTINCRKSMKLPERRAAKTAPSSSVLSRRRGPPRSKLFNLLHGKGSRGKAFNRGLAALIVANTFADILITVPEFEATWGRTFNVFESVSSLLFLAEYVARFAVAGERDKFRGALGRLRYALSPTALVDLASFLPWVVEIVLALAHAGAPLPATALVRVFRMLRILKTERFVGSVDAIWRVVWMNSSILCVGSMMALMLLIFTSTMLYYANRKSGDPTFASIPATMYLSILMLTGQGEPEGELTVLTKFLCAFTAIFSVGMVAIPASMLTFGFEIEATRLAKKRREARLRRRLRFELKDDLLIPTSSSDSDSDHDAKQKRRRDRRQARRDRKRPSSNRRLDLCCPHCACCWRQPVHLPSYDDDDDDGRGGGGGFVDAWKIDKDEEEDGFLAELDSSEEEYEELILGKTLDDAYQDVKKEILNECRASTDASAT
ncbi:hypothetical protein CTAYLR_008399 [Chrysophaeum taylorii]|uniref:Ion transport domain-containing protein n=1 Tax=Chrysophaeum taylorii TaxID=2483200 RepID=A0AAD7XKJ0_9STRA|nr:hypothetical protein CTAYLR_008399 [Chrysophaeum taylorii]